MIRLTPDHRGDKDRLWRDRVVTVFASDPRGIFDLVTCNACDESALFIEQRINQVMCPVCNTTWTRTKPRRGTKTRFLRCP